MSYAKFSPDELGPGGGAFLKTLHGLGLADVHWKVVGKTREISVNNLTIINFVLKFIEH
jgi:UDP-N-acetylglucosamine--dolichyl-phosphate N-acetylglucosaminephosphotransferase